MEFVTMQNTFAQNANALMQTWSGSRKQVSLWFDLKINRDVETLEIIQTMKSKREFRRSVMLGLKIIWELKQGRVDTLLREFPQVTELLQVKVTPPAPSGAGGLDELKGMLEIVLANQQTGNKYEMKSSGAGLPAAPVAEVKQAAAVSADDIADNFLNAFF